MTRRFFSPSRQRNRFRFILATFIAVLVTGAFPNRATAEVSANVSIWHGYDFFYPTLDLSSTNPPVTFHWMESSSGLVWKQFGSTNGGNNFFLTNDLNAVIHQFTNGLWKLYLNRGDAAEQLYFFAVSITGVTTSVLGNVTIFSPLSGSTGVTNQPTFHWVGPSNLATVVLQAYHSTSGNSYYETLPGTTTNYTLAGTLTPGPNTLFVQYFSNNFPGITFTTPTNSSGVPLADWSAQGDLHTYLFSSFTVAAPPGGGGGPGLFGHYRFDDPGDLTLDSSGLGHDATSLLYTGAGTQSPQYDPGGVDGGAVEFDGYNAVYWENEMTNALQGSFSVSLWLKTAQIYGLDNDNPNDGASIFDAGNPMPMVQTGSKLAFDTGYGSHTLYSIASINSGAFEHLVVTRDATTGEKRIYVNGVLDTSDFGATGSAPPAFQVRLGHSFDADLEFQGLVDDLQVYTNALSASQIDFLYNNPGTTVPAGGSGGHTNIAHYRFDLGNGLEHDSSPAGNDFNGGSSWGLPIHVQTNSTAAGDRAVYFYGNSSITLTPGVEAFTNLQSVLADSFSVSLWLNTEAAVGSDAGEAVDGASILWLYDDQYSTNGVIPVAVTGNKAAFYTGDELGNGSTLHSTSDVNDGSYHHIVVTRQRSTGQKMIYVDGVLEATETGSTQLLNGNNYYLSLGGVYFSSFTGFLDDIQIYAGVLSASEVSDLYTNPGTTIPDTTGGSAGTLAEAVNATNLAWTTIGNTNWFPQTSISHDGAAAARSGAIGNDESTTIQTQVYGTNTLTFWWKTDTEENSDYLEFYDNGNFVDALSGDSGWQQYDYDLTHPGLHTLEWRYTKDSSGAAGQDAAFLDQVSLAVVPPRAPILFSMTLIRQQAHAFESYGANQVNYVLYPALDSPGSTLSQHRVESPNNLCHGLFGSTNEYVSSSTYLSSFSALANELTNGSWRVWLDKDTPQEEFYTFTISAVSFTSNSLPALTILSPTNGGTALPANPAYQWVGLNGWSDIYVSVRQDRFGTNHYYSSTSLGPTQTSWTGVGPLADGTNIFDIRYAGNHRNADFAVSTPFSGWSVDNIRYQTAMASGFIVSGSAAPPPNLSIVFTSSNTVAVSWPSPSTGFNLYANTNLATTNWATVGLIPTDNGSTKTVVINPPVGDSFFRLAKPVP